jgi:hypothetical protein
VQTFVDSRVAAVVESPDFLAKVAEEIQPYMIFDGTGSVLHDGGARKYFEE